MDIFILTILCEHSVFDNCIDLSLCLTYYIELRIKGLGMLITSELEKISLFI